MNSKRKLIWKEVLWWVLCFAGIWNLYESANYAYTKQSKEVLLLRDSQLMREEKKGKIGGVRW